MAASNEPADLLNVVRTFVGWEALLAEAEAAGLTIGDLRALVSRLVELSSGVLAGEIEEAGDADG